MLDHVTADRLAAIALGHVETEFPNHIVHWLNGPEDAAAPRDLHPIFYGSFDWHSCVHSYWLLARLAADGLLSATHENAIETLFVRRIHAEAVAGELAYFQPPGRAGYERPYGWAWLLKLAAELTDHPNQTLRDAGDTLAPLTRKIAALWKAYWPKQTYPIRAGVHSNSAFATVLGLDYAETVGDTALHDLLCTQARRWYSHDRDQPAWEPGGDEFLSPALIEAVAMQRVLDAPAFARWFATYLPRMAEQQPDALFTPATVTDRSDGKLAHLDGLNLSRAWCWSALAQSFSGQDPRADIARHAADIHRAAAMDYLEADYMGSHWLASFARLAME